MPQLTQIVPKYGHPHVETFINDNTEFYDGVRGEDVPIARSIFVVTSERGPDGRITTLNSQAELVKRYGQPDMERYGQPMYNAYNFLSNRDVMAYVLRVTADNSTYANTVIAARVKVNDVAELDEEMEKITEGDMEVVISSYSLEGLSSKSEIENALKVLSKEDDEGYKVIPLMVITSTGRGEYGNSYRTRIVRDLEADGEVPFANYRVEAYELSDTLRARDAVSGSLYYDAIAYGNTYYLGDLFDDPTKNRDELSVVVYEEGIDTLYELYMDTIKPDVIVPIEQFDFIYGIQVGDDNDPIEGYTLNHDHPEFVVLDSPDGLSLENGHDGDLEYERDEEKVIERQIKIDNLYTRAFAGEIDKTIKSKRRTPAELFFDADYSEETKLEIRTLMLNRYDCQVYFDGGFMNSLVQVKAYAEDSYNLGDRIFSHNFQTYQLRDPFTAKRITVTYTHFLAGDLTRHIVQNGMEVPYAMEDRTLLSGHIRNSLSPEVDADDPELKEHLYLNRMNYVMTTGDNKFVRGTQSTSNVGTTKRHWSDLNEEHNMRVLLHMKRAVEGLVDATQYNFSEAEDRQRFTLLANILIDENYDSMVHSWSVRFDMNEFEEQRSILHCYLEVSFKAISKRGIIEIDVNPRR